MKQILLTTMMVSLTSCSLEPIKRNQNNTAIDKIEACVLRLIEKNGVNPTEAEQVCSRIFRKFIEPTQSRR